MIKTCVLALLISCTSNPGSTPVAHGNIGYDETTTLSAGNNELSPPATTGVLDLTPVATSRLVGLDAYSSTYGDSFWVRNVSATLPLIIGTSGAAIVTDQIHTPSGADFLLAPGRTVMIQYFEDITTGGTHDWHVMLPPGVYGATATASPTRVLGTAFRPSTVRPTWVSYGASATCALSLTSGAAGSVELLSDTSNPPTTIRQRVSCSNTGTLSLGNATVAHEAPLSYWVDAGDFVLLRAVTTTGTPTLALTLQVEKSL